MRKTAVTGLTLLFLSLQPAQAFAQNQEKTLNTLVSRVDAELKNGFIKISWIDSPDIRGPVYIYRSNTAFPLQTNAALPYPIAVPYGIQSYIDEADRPGTYHYFAAASDDAGKKYTTVRPYHNTLSVTVGRDDLFGFAFASAMREVHGPRPGGETLFTGPDYSGVQASIEELQAVLENGRIRLNFRENGKDAVLYRSTRPIRTRQDLVQSVIAGQGSASPFIDYPVPGIPYFYALILEEELNSGYVPLRAGSNVTAGPVEVPFGLNRPGVPVNENRVRPLPVPLMNADPPQNPPVPLSEQAAKALEVIAGAFDTAGKEGPDSDEMRARQKPFREPDVFMEDLETLNSGEQAQLGIIIQGSFSSMNWEKAAEELRHFLSLPRSGPLAARSRFYLGQACYFLEMPREALLEFLAAQPLYPNESQPWIETVLARLAE
jgi:hypothetical protein